MFVERCNHVRKRIPFAWWITYDLILGPFLIWGLVSLSIWFVLPLAALVFAAFFDVTEAVVKWEERQNRHPIRYWPPCPKCGNVAVSCVGRQPFRFYCDHGVDASGLTPEKPWPGSGFCGEVFEVSERELEAMQPRLARERA